VTAVAAAPALATAPARAGAGALEALYRDHHDFVWRVVRRLGAPDGAVDDLVQDVFLVVRRRLAGYRERGSARSWLLAIARRVVADHRKLSRHAQAREAAAPVPAPAEDLERALERERSAAVVRRFLDELPEEQRIVFFLVEVEGLSAPEVSRAMGVRLNTVYSRLRLAREKFERVVDAWRTPERAT
jgi:RNA polymerase sigma-70 factor (ECF subfamily)